MDLVVSLKGKCLITDDQIRSSTPLSPSEYRGIVNMSEGEELSATEFSKRMGLSLSRGSRVIEKMIQNGYLKRYSPQSNRRATMISLAQKGTVLQGKIFKMKMSCEHKIKNKLTQNEFDQVKGSLRKLIDIL